MFNCEMDYYDVIDSIKKKDKTRFLYTVEFFPEEGKYHYDGHRTCNISFSPSETKKNGRKCPICKKGITVGVMNRVDELADREEGFVPDGAIPSKHLVPLLEIIAEAFSAGVNTVKVKKEYERLVALHTEFEILIDLPEAELYKITDRRIVEGILRVRAGDINITPGYDGVYGNVSIFPKKSTISTNDKIPPPTAGPEQGSLF